MSSSTIESASASETEAQPVAPTPTSLRGTAIVTGAAQGIGRAIARRLAADGFDLALFDLPARARDLDALAGEVARLGRAALCVAGDVSEEADVARVVRAAVAQFGGVDVMVANAGIVFHNTLVETDVAAWDRLLAVNVRGAMLCYKHAALQMIAQGRGGRIVGAASIAGKTGQANASAYCASKFAVRGLTQSAALELGKHGITVNAYAPGPIDTPFLGQFDEFYTRGAGAARGSWTESLKDKCATKTIGSPEDVAGVVSYLVSKEAHFITGQSIILDGGSVFD